MPNVGRKKFKYTKKGEDEANAYAKKHGRKVKRKKNPGYTFESTVNSVLNKLNEFAAPSSPTTRSSERVQRSVGRREHQVDVADEGETEQSRWERIRRTRAAAHAAAANPTTIRRARGTLARRRGTPTR